MSEIVNEATIRVVADASGVEAGLRPAVDAAQRAGQAVSQAGERAAGAGRAVEAAQRNIIASIQRTTMAMEAGGRNTAAYYEQLANQRAVDPTSLAPYLNRLRELETAQNQAAESARNQAAAERELAQAQATKDSFLAGLREQIALFGKSTDEVLRYRAAQAGAGEEASQLILQLQNMRAAHEQVAEAARVEAQAQRDAAQAQATRDSFLGGLREQIALYGKSAEEVLRYRAAQAGAGQDADVLIAQLQGIRHAHEQAASAAQAQAAAQREIAQAQAARTSFVEGLQDQIALFGRSADEILQYRAAQLGAAEAAAPLITQLRELRQAEEQAAQSARAHAQAQRDADQAQASRTSFLASLTSQVNAIGKTRSQLLEMQAAQLGVSDQAAPLIQRLRETERAFGDTGMSAGETANAMRQVPAQVTDIITSLQGGMEPLTVLIQQGGQLRDSFGGIGPAAKALGAQLLSMINPLVVAAAGVATLSAAYYQGSKEADGYTKSLILSGNAIGLSSAQLAEMARSIDKVKGTQSEAAAALTAMVEAGVIARDGLKEYSTLAVSMQSALGKSVEETASEFAELGDAPLETLEKLNEKYNFLTAAVYAQVKALVDQGREEDAAALAQKTYSDAMGIRTDEVVAKIGAIESAWKSAKKSAKEAWDEFVDFGRRFGEKETDDQTLTRVRNMLQLKREGLASEVAEGNGGSGFSRQLRAEIAALETEENRLQGIVVKRNEENAAVAAGVKLQRDKQEWQKEGEKYLSREAQMLREIQKAREAGADAFTDLNPEEREKKIGERIALIQKKYSDVLNVGIDLNIAALRRRDAVAEELAKRELGRIDAQRALGDISGDEALRATAKLEQAEITRRQDSLRQEIALLRNKSGSEKEQADLRTRIAVLDVERVSRAIQLENSLAAAQQARNQANEDNHAKGVLAAQTELKSLRDQVDAQVLSNAEIGLSKIEVADLAALRLNAAASLKEEAAAAQAALPGGQQLAEIYRQQAAELRSLAKAKQTGAVKQDAADTGRKELEELNRFLDPTRAQTFGEALREAFGTAGDSLSRLLGTLDGYGRREAEIAKHRETAEKNRGKGGFDEIKYLKTMAELSDREVKNRLQGYGDMASAAKGFFSDGSKGYKMMEGAERAFRAMELASQMESLYTHLFVTTTKATATATGQTVETGAVVAGEAARNVAKVPGVFMSFMSAMGPWGMAAAAAAIAAVLGGAFSGGGGMSLSESRQKTQGTGTVLGSDAKSESIDKSLKLIEDATFQGLSISNDMLAQLRSIDSNLTGFSSLVVQTTSIKGSLSAGLESGSGGFWGKLGNSIFGGKTTVEDSGFSLDPVAFASIFQGKLNSYEYADTKKSGGWFSSDKYRTQTEGLGQDGNRQIAMALTSLYKAVESAGGMLGIAGDDFTTKLNSFVVDIGKVSLKGLSGEEMEKEIQAVFSKVGDQLAAFSVEGLGKFQQTGEGYLETLTRIAVGYQTVTVVADSLGMPFDAIGLGSIEARQRLIDLAGGLDEFKDSADSFMSDFYTDKERADALRARLQPTLDRFGIQTGADDSMQQFRDVVKGLKLETAEGAQDFATLMQIMPAFKQIADVDAKAFEEAVELAKEKRLLEIEIIGLSGDAAGQLAAQRALELSELDASIRPVKERIYALEDEKEALELSKSALSLQAQIYELTGDKAGAAAVLAQQHAMALADLDPALRGATQQVWALEAAVKATEQVKSDASSLLAGVDSAFAVLDRIVKREKSLVDERIAAEKKIVDKHQELSKALRSTLDGMVEPSQELFNRQNAQAQIQAALAIAKAGGSLPDAESLKRALSVVGQDASALYATQQDYLRDFYTTQNDIASLADLTDSTLSVEEKSLKALEEEGKRLDSIIESAQRQIDVLKGIDVSALSIDQGIAALAQSITTAMRNPVVGGTGAINSAYQSALGRAPDPDGLKFYQDQLAKGISKDVIVDAIKNSPEAKLKAMYQEVLGRAADAGGLQFYMEQVSKGLSLDVIKQAMAKSDEGMARVRGIPGFANGGDFGGGLRWVGERAIELEATGPSRIHSTQALMSALRNPSEGNAALVAEVRALRQEVAALRETNSRENYAIAKHGMVAADRLEMLEKWDMTGTPAEREA